ncbi:Y+L amino acid transporter 2-like [Ixodes scapularis]
MCTGTTIFVVPSIVFRNAGSVGTALVIWLVTGVTNVLAGLCHMELATLLPASGGGYAYVVAGSKSFGRFGDVIPFMYAWNFLILGDPLIMALQAQIFSSYILSILYPGCLPPYAAKLLLALAFTLNHLYDAPLFNSETTAGKLAVAYFATHIPTGGWKFVSNFAGEIANPSRNIPLAMFGGLLIATLLVFLYNLFLFTVLDSAAMASTEVVAVTFVATTWGSKAATLMPLLISVGVFGTSCAVFFANSRVILAAARQRHFPAIFSTVNVDSGVPLTSLLLRALLSVLYTFLGSVTFIVEALPLIYSLNNGLILVSFFVLRVSMKDAPRPYRAPTLLAAIRVLAFLIPLGARLVQPVDFLPFAFLAGGSIAGCAYYVVFVRLRLTLPGAPTFTCFLQKLLKSCACVDELEVMLREKM